MNIHVHNCHNIRTHKCKCFLGSVHHNHHLHWSSDMSSAASSISITHIPHDHIHHDHIHHALEDCDHLQTTILTFVALAINTILHHACMHQYYMHHASCFHSSCIGPTWFLSSPSSAPWLHSSWTTLMINKFCMLFSLCLLHSSWSALMVNMFCMLFYIHHDHH